MKSKVFKNSVVALALILAVNYAQGFFLSSLFMVSGTITFQGQPAQKDQMIAAYIGEEKIVESKVRENGVFELRIPQYDPSTPDIKGYHSPTDVIQVRLDGRKAKPTFNPNSDQLKIDLRVETTLDVKLSTWGKIKALFK